MHEVDLADSNLNARVLVLRLDGGLLFNRRTLLPLLGLGCFDLGRREGGDQGGDELELVNGHQEHEVLLQGIHPAMLLVFGGQVGDVADLHADLVAQLGCNQALGVRDHGIHGVGDDECLTSIALPSKVRFNGNLLGDFQLNHHIVG